jgi:Zn-finger nucleic acid-binding protein
MERILSTFEGFCPVCEIFGDIEIKEKDTQALYEGKAVNHTQEYNYCPDCKEEWVNSKQLNKILTSIKSTAKK